MFLDTLIFPQVRSDIAQYPSLIRTSPQANPATLLESHSGIPASHYISLIRFTEIMRYYPQKKQRFLQNCKVLPKNKISHWF